MVTTENDWDEILTLDRSSITVRDHAKGRALCPRDRIFGFSVQLGSSQNLFQNVR